MMKAPWIQAEDRRQFASDGYMVIRGVIPTDLVQRAVTDIAAFVGADLEDSRTWYRNPAVLDGVVPMHHAQSLWDIRQCPNLYEVFSEFFGTTRLMLDINRCIFRPPVNRRYPTVSHGNIHWDTDPRLDCEPTLQTVIFLSDVARNSGGFQCIPGIYQNLEEWLARYAMRPDFSIVDPGLNHAKTVQVEGKAGDIVLWSTLLPHGTATNSSKRPRFATFVTMQPPDERDETLRETMKNLWLTKRAPACWRGMPGQLDPEPGPPAVLTELGRKLIGDLPW